jgi:hypothetical protein
MQKILSCSMRFSLFSPVSGWCVPIASGKRVILAMPALFHNQEFSMLADKSMQMFYGEEDAVRMPGRRENRRKMSVKIEGKMGLN